MDAPSSSYCLKSQTYLKLSFSTSPSTAATTARVIFKTWCKLVADLSYMSLVINPQANQQHRMCGTSTSKATLSYLESVPAVNEVDKACQDLPSPSQPPRSSFFD